MDIRHVTSLHGNIHFNGLHHLTNHSMSPSDICITDTCNSVVSIYDIYRIFDLPIPESPSNPKDYRKHLFFMYTNLYHKLQPDPIIGVNSNLVKNVPLDIEIENRIHNYVNTDNKNMRLLIYRFSFDYLQRHVNIEGKKISDIIEDIISRTKIFSLRGYDSLKNIFKEAFIFFENNKFIKLNKHKTHFSMVIPANIQIKNINESLIITIWSKYKNILTNMLTFEEAVNFIKSKEDKLTVNTCQQLVMYYFKCELL